MSASQVTTARIYIDLADKEWRAIEIDEDGWRVVDEPPVYFRRSNGMKSLPEPLEGGSIDNDLRPLLNVKNDNEFVLAVAWLLAALRRSGALSGACAFGRTGQRQELVRKYLARADRPQQCAASIVAAERAGHLHRSEQRLCARVRQRQWAAGLVVGYVLPALTGGGFSARNCTRIATKFCLAQRGRSSSMAYRHRNRSDLADRVDRADAGAISDEQRKLEKQLWRI